MGVIAIGKPGTPPMISLLVTLGLAILSGAVVILMWGQDPLTPPGIQGSIAIFGAQLETQRLLVIVVTAITFVLMSLFFGKTYLGMGLTASASNPRAARLVGINVRGMGFVSFAVAGALGGLAGVLIAPTNPVSFYSDLELALSGFAAAVFGGLNSPLKTAIGGLVLGRHRATRRRVRWRVLPNPGGVADDARRDDRTTQEPGDGGGEMRTGKASYVAVAGVALIAVVVPLFLSDLTFFVQMVLAAVVVTGLSLLMGYSGQVSLGQGAFVAVGALTVALMTTKGGLPPLLALACAPVAAGIFAYVVGAPLLRLRGHYLAFGTLALLLIVQALMGNLDVFGAGTGIAGIPPLGVGDFVVSDQLAYAYIALAALALVLLVSRNLVRSRFGRGIRALSGSESAASSSGVPVLPKQTRRFCGLGCLRRTRRRDRRVLHPVRQPRLVPADAVVRVRDHGGDRRTRDAVGRGDRGGARFGPAAGAQQPGEPARTAADGLADPAICGIRDRANLRVAVHPAGNHADRVGRGAAGFRQEDERAEVAHTRSGGEDTAEWVVMSEVRTLVDTAASTASPEITLLYLIKQLELAVRSHLDETVRDAGLTALQYTALTVLERHPELTSAQLARNSFVRAQTMAQMITVLDGRGLITRERDPKSHRQYLLSLTPEGHRVLGRLREPVRGIETAMVQGLADAEIRQLRHAL